MQSFIKYISEDPETRLNRLRDELSGKPSVPGNVTPQLKDNPADFLSPTPGIPSMGGGSPKVSTTKTTTDTKPSKPFQAPFRPVTGTQSYRNDQGIKRTEFQHEFDPKGGEIASQLKSHNMAVAAKARGEKDLTMPDQVNVPVKNLLIPSPVARAMKGMSAGVVRQQTTGANANRETYSKETIRQRNVQNTAGHKTWDQAVKDQDITPTRVDRALQNREKTQTSPTIFRVSDPTDRSGKKNIEWNTGGATRLASMPDKGGHVPVHVIEPPKALRNKPIREDMFLGFSDYLTELKLTLQYHDDLNPKLWEEGKLKPEVRKALIKFGQSWAEFAKIPKSMIQDIVMTGGNANYNYTGKSDIDVHVIIDRSKLFSDPKFVEEYLQDKKSLWTLTHNIDVYGYPLEPYAQDIEIKYPKNQGVFSLLKNEWVQKPRKIDYDFRNDHLLKQKVAHYMHAIDHMIKHHMGDESFNNLKVRFKNMRTASLQKYGEFGRENLVFKELRNRGYIDKMNKYESSVKDKELSLK